MKIVGIIVEYNPLHNGHIHHVQEIKHQANPDLIIAVLSSSFTMRGDLSLFDKFTKTRQALQNQVDIVIELPMALCLHRADSFAEHAVALLNLLAVDEIWIGSEKNNSSLYEECFRQFSGSEKSIEEKMRQGYSYKKAADDIYSLASNDILGYSYYKAIQDKAYPIELKTIQRIKSEYLDTAPSDSQIASALFIRNNISTLKQYAPEFVSADIDKILREERLFPFIKYRILSSLPTQLNQIFFVDEGIEYKLKEIASFTSYSNFIKHLTSKRYTSTRIKRMLVYILCNITKTEMNVVLQTPLDWIRILGYTSKGREYLSTRKKDVLVYTNIKEGLNPILDIELRISRLLDSIYGTTLFQQEQKAPQYKE